MKNKVSNYEKTLEKLFKKYDYRSLIKEADEEETPFEEPADEPVPTEDENGSDAPAPDATMPTEEDIAAQEGETEDDANELPTDEDSIIISKQEQADIANSILAALMATPPQSGIIPEKFLTITPQNANDAINFFKKFISMNSNSPVDDMGQIANNII